MPERYYLLFTAMMMDVRRPMVPKAGGGLGLGSACINMITQKAHHIALFLDVMTPPILNIAKCIFPKVE